MRKVRILGILRILRISQGEEWAKSLVQELKSILFIEMEGAWMIVCIHHYKSATGLVVLISELLYTGKNR